MLLIDYLKTNADEVPNQVALWINGTSTTYGALYQMILGSAAGLKNTGVTKGNKVTLIVSDQLEFIVNYLAITRLGAVVNPVSSLLTEYEVQRILISLRPEYIVTCSLNRASAETSAQSVSQQRDDYRPVIMDAGIRFAIEEIKDVPPPNEDDDMTIYLSSGTTGEPKLVLHNHKQLTRAAQLFCSNYSLSKDDTMLFNVPLTSLYGGTCLLGGGFIGRATIVIEPAFKVNSILASLIEYQATVFAGVPTHFSYLAYYMQQSIVRLTEHKLRLAISAGSNLPQDVYDLFRQLFQAEVSNHYGCTEVGYIGGTTSSEPYVQHNVGHLNPIFSIAIVDKDGNAVAEGEEGQLLVKGEHVNPRYVEDGLHRSALDRNGFLHTGDLAKIDSQGRLHVMGRLKDIVISGGHNINPSEVEDVIRLHSNVQECAVVGIPDVLLGEVLVAAVIPFNDQPSLSEELQQLCQQRLASYKQPRHFMEMEHFPKSALGKVQKLELKRLAISVHP